MAMVDVVAHNSVWVQSGGTVQPMAHSTSVQHTCCKCKRKCNCEMCRAELTQDTMLRFPNLFQAVLLVVIAAVSCVQGLLQDPSLELRHSRRSLLSRQLRQNPAAIALSKAQSLALAGHGGTAVSDALANANAIAGKHGLAIAGSQADATSVSGVGGTSVAGAEANSNAVAGHGGTAIADSKANANAITGPGGAAVAAAKANSNAVAGNGGTAIAKSTANANAVSV